MIEIFNNVFVGSEQDYYTIQNELNWAILHCCKNPFHCQFVGYRGSLSPKHPDYAIKRIKNEMALNLVDMDRFSANYLDFNKEMFETAFSFLDEYRNNGYKLLIHCNQGESRGPTLGMLYVARLGAFNYVDFDSTVKAFCTAYPFYNPKSNIYLTTKNLWNYFVEERR